MLGSFVSTGATALGPSRPQGPNIIFAARTQPRNFPNLRKLNRWLKRTEAGAEEASSPSPTAVIFGEKGVRRPEDRRTKPET